MQQLQKFLAAHQIEPGDQFGDGHGSGCGRRHRQCFGRPRKIHEIGIRGHGDAIHSGYLLEIPALGHTEGDRIPTAGVPCGLARQSQPIEHGCQGTGTEFASRLTNSADSAHIVLQGAKRLTPLAKHQRGPEQRRPVVISFLMLVPYFLQETLVQNPVVGFEDDFFGHPFQLAFEPLTERDGEALLSPAEILYRAKQGFAIPLGQWFKRELKGMAEEIILETDDGILDKRFLKKIWDQHQKGYYDRSALLWATLMFRKWRQTFRAL